MVCNKKLLIFAALWICCGANTINLPDDVQVEEEDSMLPCPVVCPALYAPTCGFDGADYEKFDNPCMLQVANCARKLERSLMKPFAQTDMDWCTTQLIDNLYEFFDKMDVNTDRTECLQACPMIYQPVCISNGKYRSTIANGCLLSQLNCVLNGTKLGSSLFKVLSSQKCEED